MIWWIWQQSPDQHPHKTGGASKTDAYMIKAAPIKIGILTPQNFDSTSIDKGDLLILSNNAVLFNDEQRKRVFQNRYVLYNHDCGDDSRGWMGLLRRFPEMQKRSLLNIFLSPIHWTFFHNPKNSICIPPYFEPRFKDLGKKRKKNSVCFLGNFFHPYKGPNNVKEYALKNPEKQIDIYSAIWFPEHDEMFRGVKNVCWKGKLEYQEIPDVMNKYEYCIHLPNWTEAFGRGIAESYLCGCKPIVNVKVGAMSYSWSPDLFLFGKNVEEAPKKFWDAILDVY